MNEGERWIAILDRLRAFVAEREWSQFHDPKNLAMAIASEAGELLADLRWTKGSEADAFVRDPAHRKNIEREAADIAIALALFCDRAQIDLLKAMEDKITLNEKNYPAASSIGSANRQASDSTSRTEST